MLCYLIAIKLVFNLPLIKYGSLITKTNKQNHASILCMVIGNERRINLLNMLLNSSR